MTAAESVEYQVNAVDVQKVERGLTGWTIGFLLLLVFLTWFVFTGWFRIYLPDLGQPWSEVAAVGMVALSWGLVWWIGRSKGHGLIGPGADQQPRPMIWGLTFLFVFFSAWGTANTLLLRGESNAIYRETLDIASKHLSQLRASADGVLATPGFDKFKGEVEDSWALAKKQLTTEAYCGEGPYFKELLKPVEQSFGSTTKALYGLGGSTIRYSSEQCKSPVVKQTISQRAKEYEELIREKLMQSEVAIREKVAERTTLKRDLRQDVDDVLSKLTQAENALRTGLTREELLQQLTSANSVFVKYRSALTEVNASQVKSLPMELDLRMANGLGSITQSFGIIRARFGEVWGYLFAAVMFDFFIMYVAYRRAKAQWSLHRHASEIAAQRDAEVARAKALEAERMRQASSKKTYAVKHLWVPASNTTT